MKYSVFLLTHLSTRNNPSHTNDDPFTATVLVLRFYIIGFDDTFFVTSLSETLAIQMKKV